MGRSKMPCIPSTPDCGGLRIGVDIRLDSLSASLESALAVPGEHVAIFSPDGALLGDSDRLRIAFPNTSGDITLAGDIARGTYRIDGIVSAQQLVLENVGRANGSAKITFDIGGRAPWALVAGLSARIAPVTNATLANLAGNGIAIRGGLNLGSNRPIAFNRLVVDGLRDFVAGK